MGVAGIGPATTAARTGPLSGTAWLIARWSRRRAVAVVPLLLVVAAGTSGTMLALGSAHRTSTAFDRYLERADVGDVVLNPSLRSTDVDAIVRSLPGIVEITTDTLISVTFDEGAPRPQWEIDECTGCPAVASAVAGVFGSHDGRYTDMDRPVIQAGRLPVGPSEVALSATAADAAGWAIGDVVPLAFWEGGLDMLSPAAEALHAGMISPAGVEHAELVGLITLPDEVLPNELYPRARVIVSPDLARRYDCVPPPLDPTLSYEENLMLMTPAGCAGQYTYYSLSFADGPAGVKPALDEFVRRVAPLNERLSTIVDPSDEESWAPQYFLIATETDAERRRVERAVRPTVTALGVVGVAAGAVTLALAAFAVARETRQTAVVQRQWRELGMTRRATAAVAAVPPMAATAVGLGVAIVATYVVGTAPVGVVRVLEPQRSAGAGRAGLLAAAAIALVSAVVVIVLVARASRPGLDAAARSGRPGVGQLWGKVGPPPLADGLRNAFGRRDSLPVVAGGAVLSAALAAAIVFGASLSALVGTPRSYGWPWDLAAMTGGGYGDLDLEGARAAFDDDPAVATWTAFGFANELSLDGEPMMAMIGVERQTPEIDLPVLAGQLPRRSDEVALGPATAADRGLGVGDTVTIGGWMGVIEATVTGIAVFPTIGPLFADTLGGGNGLLVPQTMMDDAIAFGEPVASGLAAFAGVTLVDGADDEARAGVEERLQRLDLLGYTPPIYQQGVRPPEIIEAAATRSVPLAVGISLAAVSALGLGIMSWASVRSRRRDFAVLRALGLSPGQVRWSVRVQALAVTAAALTLGVPLGVIAGRLLWRSFADQLGVVPDAAGSWTAIASIAAVALLLAVVAAELPARRAAGSRPAADLRAE